MKRKQKKLLVIFLWLIVLALLVVLSFSLLKKQDNNETLPSQVTDSTNSVNVFSKDDDSYTEIKPENSETSDSDAINANNIITYSISSEQKNNSNGNKIIDYQYPVFYTKDDSYSSVVTSMNQDYSEKLHTDLDADAGAFTLAFVDNNDTIYTQTIDDISINNQSDCIFISITRTQEVGGPYPNTYNESYVINTTTKDFAKLSDIITINDDTISEVTNQIYQDHSEKDWDTLQNDIRTALNNDKAHWRIDGNDLIIWFDDTDITDAYHGDGEYAAIISLQ